MPRRPIEQAQARCPRADVRHVDAQHRVGAIDRPVGSASIERQRRPQVRQRRLLAPGRDRCQRGRVGIARLPVAARESAARRPSACSPVPLAISSTRPVAGSQSASTSPIGDRHCARPRGPMAPDIARQVGDIIGRDRVSHRGERRAAPAIPRTPSHDSSPIGPAISVRNRKGSWTSRADALVIGIARDPQADKQVEREIMRPADDDPAIAHEQGPQSGDRIIEQVRRRRAGRPARIDQVDRTTKSNRTDRPGTATPTPR